MGLFGDTETEQAIYHKLNEYVERNAVVLEGFARDIANIQKRVNALETKLRDVVVAQLDKQLHATREAIIKRLVSKLPEKADDALRVYVRGSLTKEFEGLAQSYRNELSEFSEAKETQFAALRSETAGDIQLILEELSQLQQDFEAQFNAAIHQLTASAESAISFAKLGDSHRSNFEKRLAVVEMAIGLRQCPPDGPSQDQGV